MPRRPESGSAVVVQSVKTSALPADDTGVDGAAKLRRSEAGDIRGSICPCVFGPLSQNYRLRRKSRVNGNSRLAATLMVAGGTFMMPGV